MNNSWLNMTDEERKEAIYNIAKTETGLSNFNKFGVFLSILNVIISIVNLLYSQLSYYLRQKSLETAEGMWLDLLGLLIGEPRNEAVKAEGNFTGYAYSSGTISKGNWIKIPALKLRFKVLEDISFSKDIPFNIPVQAEMVGKKYNGLFGLEAQPSKVITGLDRIEIIENWLTIPGIDEESDENYRKRLKAKWQTLSYYMPKQKYASLAFKVKEVKDVSVIRAPRNYGTVDVVISVHDNVDQEAIRLAVHERLRGHEGVTRDLLVRLANKKIVNLTITYKADVSTDQIKKVVNDFFATFRIGDDFKYHKLYDELTDIYKFDSLVITPAADVPCTNYEMCVGDIVGNRIIDNA